MTEKRETLSRAAMGRAATGRAQAAGAPEDPALGAQLQAADAALQKLDAEEEKEKLDGAVPLR